MKKIGLIYWPTKGNVEIVAKEIYDHFNDNEIDVIDLAQVKPNHLFLYKNIILGCSTVGSDHWENSTMDNKWYQFFGQLERDNVDLNNKKIAIFGLGDQIKYPHHFVDGIERMYENMEKHNINLIGNWPTEGYEFYESKAVHDGKFRGLAIDLDSKSEEMKNQVKQWVDILKIDFNS